MPNCLLVIYCAFLGLGFVTMLRVAWLYVREPAFESRAKLVASARMTGDVRMHPHFEDMLFSFVGTVKEVLESPELERRAGDRVQALHPGISPCKVTLKVVRTKGSEILNLIATGPEPKYIQLHLNALLDEYISFRSSLREESANKVFAPFLQAVVNEQKKMEAALGALETAKRQAESVSAKIERARLAERLKSLRDSRDNLRLSQPEKVPSIEPEIRLIELELEQYEAAESSLRKAQELYETHKRAYQELFEQAERWMSNANLVSDYVVIQERSSVAVEQPILTWSTIGFLYPSIGFAGGFIWGLWLLRRKTPSLANRL